MRTKSWDRHYFLHCNQVCMTHNGPRLCFRLTNPPTRNLNSKPNQSPQISTSSLNAKPKGPQARNPQPKCETHCKGCRADIRAGQSAVQLKPARLIGSVCRVQTLERHGRPLTVYANQFLASESVSDSPNILVLIYRRTSSLKFPRCRIVSEANAAVSAMEDTSRDAAFGGRAAAVRRGGMP